MDTQIINENNQAMPENLSQNQKQQRNAAGEVIAAGAVGAAVGVGGAILANELIDNEGTADILEQQIAQAEKELQQAEQELADTQQIEEEINKVEIDHNVFEGPMPPPHVHVYRQPEVNINVEQHIHQEPAVAGDTRAYVSGTSGQSIERPVSTSQFEEQIVDTNESDQEHVFAVLGRGVVQDENSGEERLAVVVESDGERYYLIDADGDGFFNNLVDASGNSIDMNETAYPTNLTMGDVENMYDTTGGYVESLVDIAQVEPQGENPADDIINLDGSRAQTAQVEPAADDDAALLAAATAMRGAEAGSTAETGSTAEVSVSDEELYNQLFGDDINDDDIAVYDDNSIDASVESGDTGEYASEPQQTAAYEQTTSDYAETGSTETQSYEPEPDYTASTQTQDNYTPENDYYEEPANDYTASADVPADDFSVDMIDTSEV